MPHEIQSGIYDITTREDDNGRRYRVYLFDDDVPTLVDAGHAETVETLFDALERLDIAPGRLLITHDDPDHVGGVRTIDDRYDIEIVAPKNPELGIDRSPDRIVEDGSTVGSFTAVDLPGHAHPHIGYIHDRGVAVLGDALFGSDLRGLPEGYFIVPPAVYSEDVNQADESLGKLLEYEFEIGLVYHGSSVHEGASDKIERFVDFPGSS